MRKSEYRKPELDVVVMHDNLLDTLPKNSTTYDDDDIEEGSEDDDFFISLWED